MPNNRFNMIGLTVRKQEAFVLISLMENKNERQKDLF